MKKYYTIEDRAVAAFYMLFLYILALPFKIMNLLIEKVFKKENPEWLNEIIDYFNDRLEEEYDAIQ